MYCNDDVAVICHPKTASVSLASKLVERGWETVNGHHGIGDVEGKKVLSVIREPKDWYVSWYFHYRSRFDPTAPRDLTERALEPFGQWLPWFLEQEAPHKSGFFGLSLTTHLVFFDRLQVGLDAAFEDLGVDPFVLPRKNSRGREGACTSDFFAESLADLLNPTLVADYRRTRERLGSDPFLRVSS